MHLLVFGIAIGFVFCGFMHLFFFHKMINLSIRLRKLLILSKNITRIFKMDLFYKGDIIQLQDKSQWEIEELIYDCNWSKGLYKIRSIATGEVKYEEEFELNRKGYVIKFADIPGQRKQINNIYYLKDYKRKSA